MTKSSKPETIQTIAVIGAGLIGSSWSALFLAKGYKVIAQDPAAKAGEKLRTYISHVWQDLSELGLSEGASLGNLRFTHSLAQACTGADFIQENAPEDLALKQALYQDIETHAPIGSIIASSTSSLLISDLQAQAKYPERFIVAHPFTPPHLIPLVEIVGGKQTSTESVDTAMRFYALLGKHPIQVKREAVGHICNRLTSALYREAVHLVEAGIASVEDVDAALSYGPGMRWAFIGAHLSYHLAGGEGGYRHYLEHLGRAQEERWRHLGQPQLTEQLKDTLVEGVDEAYKGTTIAELQKQRDKGLVALLKLKKELG